MKAFMVFSMVLLFFFSCGQPTDKNILEREIFATEKSFEKMCEKNLSLREFFILSGKDKKIIVGSMCGINFSNKYFLVIISNRKVK